MALAVPLRQAQIAAAHRLHKRMARWQSTDAALRLVAERFRGFDHAAALVKVVCLNGLYGTNLYAVHRMAAHIVDMMADAHAAQEPAGLVEKMARLPPLPGEKQPRRHLSFASKFCHFFIDAARFPILDGFAVSTVRRHLGPALRRDRSAPYRALIENIETLRRISGVTANARELDCYLWIAGAYHARQRKPATLLNADLSALMTDPACRDDLRVVAGANLRGARPSSR